MRARRFNQMTSEALLSMPAFYMRPLADLRQEQLAWSQKNALNDAAWRTIEKLPSPLRLRTFRAGENLPICVHVHGGGWVMGGADHQDAYLDELSVKAEVCIASVAYRLSPENPFPAGLDDVTRALRHFLDDDTTSQYSDKIVVCGESAGANLLVGALVRLRSHKNFSRIRGAFLNYGTFDLTGTESLRAAADHGRFLDLQAARWFTQLYIDNRDAKNPEVSPAFANLQGLPPACFLVGDEDPVVDDSRLLHRRWQEAGNTACLQIVPAGLHGMLEMRTPLTALARDTLAQSIRDALRQPA